ncbi:MAG: class I SAM-dependent methyltransferase [Desulfovibrio sp.]|nr:class I SAM-dependent methyltransferase [Desulfovibrio sp.]
MGEEEKSSGAEFAQSLPGRFALESGRGLMRGLMSGWPRRARSALVLGALAWSVAENLWEAGFDVTVQDGSPGRLEAARAVLGQRVEYALSSPDHLPFDDSSFDYAVAGPFPAPTEQADAVLVEMGRLACSGILVIFFNSWSFFGLECRMRRKIPLYAGALACLQSPRAVAAAARRVFSGKRRVFASILPGPLCTWRGGVVPDALNRVKFPLPLGALAALRVDFGPLYAVTPLLLGGKPAVPARS